jgi:chemotaxis signal transduction protein
MMHPVGEALPEVPDVLVAGIDCVFCTVAGRRWGVRLGDVGRIVAGMDAPPVAIPHSPAWARGVFRRGADFVTLIDTAQFLGGAPSIPARWQRDDAIMLLSVGDAQLGLFVRELSLVSAIVEAELALADAATNDPPYLLGWYYPAGERAAQAAGAVYFLDVARIAADCLRALDGEGGTDAAD